MSDRYARYQRLKFDRPHPRVLRITLNSPLKMNAMDALMHRRPVGAAGLGLRE
jgi:enoyl-CoA hydratase